MIFQLLLQEESLTDSMAETASELLQHNWWEETSTLDLAISLFIFVMAWLLRELPSKIFFSLFTRQAELQAKLKENKPPAFLLPLLAWMALNRWVLSFPVALELFIGQVNAALLIFILTRAGLAWLKSFMQVKFLGQDKWRLKQGSIKFYFRLVQVITWLVVILAILSIFGVNVGSLAAGLGLGGLAISLAAQDSLSNLIAGFVLLNDPDLKVGDDIEILGQSGTLVDLGLRSSQIRAYDRSLITIPNKLLSENILLNISRMDKRRVLFSLRLPLTARADDLAILKSEVSRYLKDRDRVDPEGIYCNLDGIQDTGIDMYVRFFVLDPSWDAMMEEKKLFLEFLWELLLARNLAEPKQGLRVEFVGSELSSSVSELSQQMAGPEIRDGGK